MIFQVFSECAFYHLQMCGFPNLLVYPRSFSEPLFHFLESLLLTLHAYSLSQWFSYFILTFSFPCLFYLSILTFVKSLRYSLPPVTFLASGQLNMYFCRDDYFYTLFFICKALSLDW